MNDYNDGKIHGWNGGECPVHPESVVTTWMRCGKCVEGWQATSFGWGHYGGKGDIVCFQVTKPYVEPKVIWVNEYKAGLVSHYSEIDARRATSPNPVRIAVKYVEAKE